MKIAMLQNIGKTMEIMYKKEIQIRETNLEQIPIEEGFKTFLNKKNS